MKLNLKFEQISKNLSADGKYRIIRMLGQGGMGEVYLANQEFPIKRKVAVKLVKQGFLDDLTMARFSTEAQAMAQLDHSGIAKIFDSGLASDGKPYFILEFVDGMTLDAFQKSNNLSLIERIEVFLMICEAVHYAHQKNIIHRDLKPNNILVSAGIGVVYPKIIDFGIAKLNQPEFFDSHTPNTATGNILGSPGYLCPEILLGKKVENPKTLDVYSLGIILFELLTNHKPYDSMVKKNAPIYAYLNAIQTHNPPSVVNILKQSNQFSGHNSVLKSSILKKINWVYLKSVDPNPKLRYQSVSDLIRDLRASLSGEKTGISFVSKLSLRKPKKIYPLFIFLFLLLFSFLFPLFNRQAVKGPIASPLEETLKDGIKVHLNSIQRSEIGHLKKRVVLKDLLNQNFDENYSIELKNEISNLISFLLAERGFQPLLEELPPQRNLDVELLIHEPYGHDFILLGHWLGLGSYLTQEYYIAGITSSHLVDNKYWSNFKLQLKDRSGESISLDMPPPPFLWYAEHGNARIVIFESEVSTVLSFLLSEFYGIDLKDRSTRSTKIKGCLVYKDRNELLKIIQNLFSVEIDEKNRTAILVDNKFDYYPIFNFGYIDEKHTPLKRFVERMCYNAGLELDPFSEEHLVNKSYTYYFRDLEQPVPWLLVMKEVLARHRLEFHIRNGTFYIEELAGGK